MIFQFSFPHKFRIQRLNLNFVSSDRKDENGPNMKKVNIYKRV
uniref:Uncharacterized protein n=1 Tax=Meloidogyne enterolobii TaxID=390850 RepID=A0A6V7WZB6_MELEN|nr:unnamed protein product [Meloidogyne enterolobii]